MSNVYFNTLSGMMAASFGLKTVSDNVANMQSPGFKGQTVFYSSLGSNGYSNNLGNGVSSGESKVNFKQGNITQSGVKSQMAIDGNGFFIIELKNGEYLYTRDGEFSFNDDGYLIDEHSGGYVMGYSASGKLIRLTNIGEEKYPGQATSEIDLGGMIVYEIENKKTDNNPETYKDQTFEVEVYDASGISHKLTITLKISKSNEALNSPDTVSIKSITENGNSVNPVFIGLDYISYSTSTFPDSYRHSIKFSCQFEGNDAQEIKLNFGKNSSNLDKVVKLVEHTGINDKTTIKISDMDGYGEGLQYDYAFDENGQISYLYTNQQTTKGIHVALANFDNPQAQLQAVSNNAFRAKVRDGMYIGRANDGAFGSIKPQYLELSNVDSTNEFANIVILQRMFQACSQVMEIDKQLLEELYKK